MSHYLERAKSKLEQVRRDIDKIRPIQPSDPHYHTTLAVADLHDAVNAILRELTRNVATCP